MSVYGGPEITNNGLVFAYDMANTQKSWKGAPTTNLVGSNFFNGNGNFTVNQNVTDIMPDGTIGISRELNAQTVVDANRTVSIGSYNLTAGATYNLSFYAKNINCTGFSGNLYSPTLSRVIGGITYPTLNTSTWTRVTTTFTVPNEGPNPVTLSPQVFRDGGYGLFRLCWLMLEQQSFATPYVDSSRSTAQSITDLTNNNLVTASSLTYGSDSSFNFIGANSNYLTIGTTNDTALKGTTAYTVMGWINCSTSGPNGYSEFYMANSGGLTSSCINIFWYNNTIGFFTGTGSFYSYQIAVGTLSYNTWYHVTAVINYTNSLFSVYLNGIYKGQSSFTTYTPAGTTVTIGKNSCTGNAGDYTTGRIPMLSVYNRALSAEEVLNNFNAMRGRFNL